jgi:hypothetical protein
MLSIELEAFTARAIALVSTDDQGRVTVEKIEPLPVSEIMGKVRQKPDGTVERLERLLTPEDFPAETPVEPTP